MPIPTAPVLVLIGAPCVGKTVAGRAAADLLGVPFVDADDFAYDVQAQRGWSPARFQEIKAAEGAGAAYDDYEPVVAATVLAAVDAAASAVLALGAGHAHYRRPDSSTTVEVALRRTGAPIVLLVADTDPAKALDELRRRTAHDRGDAFRREGRDLLDEWVHSAQFRALATSVVDTSGQTPDETARSLAALAAPR